MHYTSSDDRDKNLAVTIKVFLPSLAMKPHVYKVFSGLHNQVLQRGHGLLDLVLELGLLLAQLTELWGEVVHHNTGLGGELDEGSLWSDPLHHLAGPSVDDRTPPGFGRTAWQSPAAHSAPGIHSFLGVFMSPHSTCSRFAYSSIIAKSCSEIIGVITII